MWNIFFCGEGDFENGVDDDDHCEVSSVISKSIVANVILMYQIQMYVEVHILKLRNVD